MRIISLGLFGLAVSGMLFAPAAKAISFNDPILKAPTKTVLLKRGEFGVNTYRIPGLAVTNRGTVIAMFDMRYHGSGDLPSKVDIGIRRSMDNGATWTPIKVALSFPKGTPADRGNGVGDGCIFVDRQTNTIWIAGLWSHGNHGWNGSGPGLSPEQTGQLVLTKSADDGATWSVPINITQQVKNPAWRLLYQGPGGGIQLHDGTLVFPAQFRAADGLAHSCFIYSKDHGATWKISTPAVPGKLLTNESQIAELANGDLLLSMRNASGKRERAWSVYSWNHQTQTIADGKWSPVTFQLPDSFCQASLIRYEIPGTTSSMTADSDSGDLLFCNPANSHARKDFTIYLSQDGGKTWPFHKLIDARPSGYSCMAVLKDGSVGVLYETGDKDLAETLTFMRFSLAWLKGSASQ